MSWQDIRFECLYLEPSRNGIYKSIEHHGTGTKIVNMGELFRYEFVGDQEMARLDMTDQELRRSGLCEGDLLFGRRSLVEAGAGKCSIVRGLVEPTTFESSLIRVRADPTKVVPIFLYYWFRSPVGRGRIRAIVSGTNVKGIRGSDLKNIFVAVPDFHVQIRIAAILAAYDDLIDNNRRRIVLLEEAARQLYKEWFVRFRFPGYEHVKIIDGVPERWNSMELADCVDVIKDTADPKSLEPDTPYIGLEHLPRRSITLAEWETAEKVESGKFRFRERDIIFGKIRPYFHKVGFTLTEGITSSDAIVMRPKNEANWACALMEVSSDRFIALASQTVKEGSKMPRANWEVLKKHRLAIPPEGLRQTFRNQIDAITSQTKALSLAIAQAAKARDLLLPKLMNGAITV